MFTGSVLSLKRRCPVQGLASSLWTALRASSRIMASVERPLTRFWTRTCLHVLSLLVLTSCVCLGGNDFPASTPVMIALDIVRLARRLLASGVQCVCIGQVCRRLRWRTVTYVVGASLVQELNYYLESFSRDTEGVFFWRHKRLWTSIRPVFRQDGVHFSDEGQYRLFRSMRRAIMASVRRIQPLGRLAA